MCLIINKPETTKFRNKIKNNGGKITVFKVLSLEEMEYNKPNKLSLVTPHQQFRVETNTPKVVLQSNRTSAIVDYDEQDNGRLNKGIHAYSSKKKAREGGSEFTVRATGYLEDFVAKGTRGHVVFTKLVLNKRDIKTGADRVIKNLDTDQMIEFNEYVKIQQEEIDYLIRELKQYKKNHQPKKYTWK